MAWTYHLSIRTGFPTTSDTDKRPRFFVSEVLWREPVNPDKCYAPKTIVQTWQGFTTT